MKIIPISGSERASGELCDICNTTASGDTLAEYVVVDGAEYRPFYVCGQDNIGEAFYRFTQYLALCEIEQRRVKGSEPHG